LVRSLLLVASLFASSQSLFAQTLTLDQVKFTGSGCPAGTVDVALSPDGTALSVLYSAFTIEAAQGSGSKTCQVVAQMQAPKGFRVHMARADLRGFNGLPQGANGTLDTTIRFTDWRDWSQTQSYSQNFAGPLNDNFYLEMATPESRWGNCGGMKFSIVLDTKFTLGNQTADLALFSMDSSDLLVGPAGVYHLALESCKGGGNGNGHGNGNGGGNGNGNGHGRSFDRLPSSSRITQR
jgi:hypothetical protein